MSWLSSSTACLSLVAEVSPYNLLQTFKTFLKNNWAFISYVCYVSVDSNTHYTKAITLVIFPVFRTNYCENSSRILFRGYGSYFHIRFWKPDFEPVVLLFWVCWIKPLLLCPHLSAILFCHAFASYSSINLISTFCAQFQFSALSVMTDVFWAKQNAYNYFF